MLDKNVRASIADAMYSWNRESVAQRVAESERLRTEFLDRFPIASWHEMPLSDYALGQSTQDTVCWWMEYRPGLAPSMKGGSAHKHLVFRSRNGSWNFPNEYDSVEAAWSAIREGFAQMLDLAIQGQYEDADDIKVLTGAPALRTKLLYTYFPNDLVPVSSKADIDYHLRAVGQESSAASVIEQ